MEVNWKVTAGELLFDGQPVTPRMAQGKEVIEEALARLKRQIDLIAPNDIAIVTILVERQMATALFAAGDLTHQMLLEGEETESGWEVMMPLCDDLWPVTIQNARTATRDDFEFLIEGHPENCRLVANLDDLIDLEALDAA